MIEIGVIHGRFQILHNDHLRYLLAGRDRCRRLVIGITNPDPGLTGEDAADPERSRPENNPLTYFERMLLVRAAMIESGVPEGDFLIVPFPVTMPGLYRFYVPLDAVFFLTIYDEWGRKKLALFRSMGLSCQVMWERPLEQKGISGREVRERMIRGEDWADQVPPAVARLLKEWDIESRLRGL
jgi:nicotinamide-nucleotide adenylyltransferase